MKKLVHKKIKRENYWEPLNKNMYDCCYCMSKDCACPCGRKPSELNQKTREYEKYITMSDFSLYCDHYVKDKVIYKLCRLRPIVDPTNPHEKNKGHIIEKEVEFTWDEMLALIALAKCDWHLQHQLKWDEWEPNEVCARAKLIYDKIKGIYKDDEKKK